MGVTRAPLPTERQVQQRVVATYEAVGCLVANFAQGYRPGGRGHATTRQTKGIPDLYVFPPRRLAFRADGNVDPFWHEVKRPGGVQSPEQKRWQEECENRGVGYVLGGVNEALAYLRKLKLVGLVPVATGATEVEANG